MTKEKLDKAEEEEKKRPTNGGKRNNSRYRGSDDNIEKKAPRPYLGTVRNRQGRA